jgi:hypothetical protein
MSFLHFGAGHANQAWSSELFVHHAGIPLALFVLLQDYRFILLDAFVRFLANALLAAVLTWFVIEAAFRLVLVERAAPAPLQEALLLISVCLFLVFFAWLRNWAQSWLTHAVFRQGSLSEAADRVKVESLRQQEMSRLVSQAELRALQSQINPHYLHTTAGGMARPRGWRFRLRRTLAIPATSAVAGAFGWASER